MNGLSQTSVRASPRCLANTGHDTGGRPRQRRHPGHKAQTESVRVGRGKTVAGVILRGCPSGEGPEAPQQGDHLRAEAGDIPNRLRPGQNRQQTQSRIPGSGQSPLAACRLSGIPLKDCRKQAVPAIAGTSPATAATSATSATAALPSSAQGITTDSADSALLQPVTRVFTR